MDFDSTTLIEELKKLDELAKVLLIPDDTSNELLEALVKMHPNTLKYLSQKCVTAFNIQKS